MMLKVAACCRPTSHPWLAFSVGTLLACGFSVGLLVAFLSAGVFQDATSASRQVQCLSQVSTTLSDVLVLSHGELAIRSVDTRRGICFLTGAAASDEFNSSWPLVMPALRRLSPDARAAEMRWHALQTACVESAVGDAAQAAALGMLPALADAQEASLNRVRVAVTQCGLPDPSGTLADIQSMSTTLAAVRTNVPLYLPPANTWNSSALQNATWVAADLQLELAVTIARSDVNLLATQIIQSLNASPAGSTMGSVGANSRTRTIIHFIGMLSSGRGTVLGYAMRIAAGEPTNMMRLKGMTAVMSVDMKLLQYRLSEFISGWPPTETSLFLSRARQLREELRSGMAALVAPMTAGEFAAALNISAPEYGASLVRDLLLLTAELESQQASLLDRVAARQSDAKASLLASISGALLALLALAVAARAWCAIARTSRLRTIEGEAIRRRQLTRTLMHEVRQPLSSLLVGMELLKGIADSVFARKAIPEAAPRPAAAPHTSSAVATASATLSDDATTVDSDPQIPRRAVDTVHSSFASAAEAVEIIDVMLEATLRLSRLTTDSLDLERMESATLPLTPVPSSLFFEVSQAVKEASFGAQPKRVRLLLAAQCDAALPACLQLPVTGTSAAASGSAAKSDEASLLPLPPDLLLLLDPDRLRQVLLNLMTNAVRHAPQGSDVRVALRVSLSEPAAPADRLTSRITICSCFGCKRLAGARVLPAPAAVVALPSSSQSAELAGAGSDASPGIPLALKVHQHDGDILPQQPLPVIVSISISDTGAGIPPAKQALLFQPFSQLHGSSRDGQGTAGSGLGLAVSRSLVQLMGGDISVASAPEQGTTFTMQFPTTTHAGATSVRSLCVGGSSTLTTTPAAGTPHTVITIIGAPDPAPCLLLAASTTTSAPSPTAPPPEPPSLRSKLAAGNASIGSPAAFSTVSPSPGTLGVSRPPETHAVASGSSPSPLTPRTMSFTAASTAAASTLAAAPLAGRGFRLLVVDDTQSNLRLLVKLAQSLGAAEVDGVGDGAAAVDSVRAKAAAGFPYHAILLDRHIPIMDGETCARTLRGPAVNYTGVILAVSADAEQSFLDAGADALVQKPVSRAALATALCRGLGIQ